MTPRHRVKTKRNRMPDCVVDLQRFASRRGTTGNVPHSARPWCPVRGRRGARAGASFRSGRPRWFRSSTPPVETWFSQLERRAIHCGVLARVARRVQRFTNLREPYNQSAAEPSKQNKSPQAILQAGERAKAAHASCFLTHSPPGAKARLHSLSSSAGSGIPSASRVSSGNTTTIERKRSSPHCCSDSSQARTSPATVRRH